MQPMILQQIMAAANQGSGGGEGSARYWRMYPTANTWYTSHNYIDVAEIAFYESTDCSGTNLSLSATVSANSEYGGYPAENAADGNQSSRWSTTSSSTAIGEWWMADFGSNKTVKSFAIQVRDAHFLQVPTEVEIQYSNDASSWTTLATLAIPEPTTAHEWLQFTDLQ